MNLNDFFKSIGYDISGLKSGFSGINEYLSWYKGFVNDFHRYYIYNGEKRINMTRYSLQMSKKICENFADLLMNEKVTITLGDDMSNKILKEILTYNNFYTKANQGIEKAFALGTGAFLLSLEDVSETNTGKIKIQFVNACDIYPLTFDENGTKECAFTNYGTKVDMHTGKVVKILNLQIHTLNEQKNYVIQNFRFVEGENKELTQIELEDDVTEMIDTGMKNRWFILIKPNIINNIDFYGPFGISIFANSLDVIKGLDQAYDSLVNEINLGRKRVYVTADAMRVGSDGCFKNAFDPNDVVFYMLERISVNDGLYIKEDNGQLRVDDLTKTIQTNLNLLSMKLGLGDNYYKFDGNTVSKTATEVISENSDLYRTLQKHKVLLESALTELVGTIGMIAGFNTENIQIDFDDSIIESKEQERLQDRQDMAIDVLSKVEYRMKWYGEDEQTAKVKIEEIKNQNNDSSSIQFLDGEVD